jgi:integrase/recombinase XerD
MRSSGTSDKYQNNDLKTITSFGRFLEPTITFQTITKRDQIIAFLDTKIKDSQIDPDKRWITTWNDYLGRIKYFFRWLHNTKKSYREDEIR